MKKLVLALLISHQAYAHIEGCDKKIENYGRPGNVLTNICVQLALKSSIENRTYTFDNQFIYAIGKHYLIRIKLSGDIKQTLDHYKLPVVHLTNDLINKKLDDVIPEAQVIAGKDVVKWNEQASLALSKHSGRSVVFILSPSEKKIFYFDLKNFGSISSVSSTEVDSAIVNGRVVSLDARSLLVLDTQGPMNQRIDYALTGEVVTFSPRPPQSWKLPLHYKAPMSCQSSECFAFDPSLSKLLKISVTSLGEGEILNSMPVDAKNPSALILRERSVGIIKVDGEKVEIPMF